MKTAVECVRQIFPDCQIKTIRLDNPIMKVTITAEKVLDGNCSRKVVWASKQQNLMAKTPKVRRRTMDIIRQSLAMLREEVALGTALCSITPTCDGRPTVMTGANQEEVKAST